MVPVPPRRRTEQPVDRLRKAIEFIERHGRRPTRKSKDPDEKTLGIWLHRFTCNDDGVKDRARQAMSAADFEDTLKRIDAAVHTSLSRLRIYNFTAPAEGGSGETENHGGERARSYRLRTDFLEPVESQRSSSEPADKAGHG